MFCKCYHHFWTVLSECYCLYFLREYNLVFKPLGCDSYMKINVMHGFCGLPVPLYSSLHFNFFQQGWQYCTIFQVIHPICQFLFYYINAFHFAVQILTRDHYSHVKVIKERSANTLLLLVHHHSPPSILT